MLGAVAVVLALVWLVRELGLDPDELRGYAASSLLLVGGLVLLAVAGAALVWLGKRVLRNRR